VSLDKELDYLAFVDESENSRYNSKAVFSGLNTGVEVEEYNNFTLYNWRSSTSFNELINNIEPFFPFTENPGLEMIKEDTFRRDAERDHVTIENEFIYDPVKEEKTKDRWNRYSLIQVNLNSGKVVYDEKEGYPRVRVYEINMESDLFEKIYSSLEESSQSEDLLTEIKQVY
jgi:hypothetical protein